MSRWIYLMEGVAVIAVLILVNPYLAKVLDNMVTASPWSALHSFFHALVTIFFADYGDIAAVFASMVLRLASTEKREPKRESPIRQFY